MKKTIRMMNCLQLFIFVSIPTHITIGTVLLRVIVALHEGEWQNSSPIMWMLNAG